MLSDNLFSRMKGGRMHTADYIVVGFVIAVCFACIIALVWAVFKHDSLCCKPSCEKEIQDHVRQKLDELYGKKKEPFIARMNGVKRSKCLPKALTVENWSGLNELDDSITNSIKAGASNALVEKFDPSFNRNGLPEQTSNVMYNSLEGWSENELAKRKFFAKRHKNTLLGSATLKEAIVQQPQARSGSNGNPRYNNKSMQSIISNVNSPVKSMKGINPFNNLGNVIIDDKGYGNMESFVPTSCSVPMCSNSRLAGSAMNVDSLIGAFGKFDTNNNFFESTDPSAPELNFLKGKPVPLKYASNPDY